MLNQLGQATPAEIRVVTADVAHAADVTHLLEMAHTSMPRLRGIFHAAGVLDDGMLISQDWERFARVMAPKTAGAWNLHMLTQDLSLDHFVCFSSASSLLGQMGQGNYAAANAFMDALAHHRRGLGLPGLSINWGPWAMKGMAASMTAQDQRRITEMGMGTIPPDAGLQLLGYLMRSGGTPQVGVLPMNGSKLPRKWATPFLAHLTSAAVPEPDQSRSAFLHHLIETPSNERQHLLIDHLRTQLASVLGMSNGRQIGLRDRLFDLGIDSLMAVELRNRLKSSLEHPLRATLLFDYPTIEALVGHLTQDVLTRIFAETEQERGDMPDIARTDVQHLSEAEAEALLLKQLESLTN